MTPAQKSKFRDDPKRMLQTLWVGPRGPLVAIGVTKRYVEFVNAVSYLPSRVLTSTLLGEHCSVTFCASSQKMRAVQVGSIACIKSHRRLSYPFRDIVGQPYRVHLWDTYGIDMHDPLGSRYILRYEDIRNLRSASTSEYEAWQTAYNRRLLLVRTTEAPEEPVAPILDIDVQPKPEPSEPSKSILEQLLTAPTPL